MTIHEMYMQRCIDLAKLGKYFVAPNPMVGAVLVYRDKIIGEGYHQYYGGHHAEVNCINSVAEADKHLISQSTLYVSLEPCVHFGKTPPCTNLIIENNIPAVIIGSRDPFSEVDGKGIEKLQHAGILVISNILEEECKELNKRFFTFHTKKRPYIILKWAQTFNQKIAASNQERLLISNEITNRLTHRWRAEEQAILIGTNTAKLDNPFLNNRLWNGKNPTRLVIDKYLQLPTSLHIFNQLQPTIIFNFIKNEKKENITFYLIDKNKNLITELLDACYRLNIQSVLVEGGANLLQSFIDHTFWDEARVITNNTLSISSGLNSPILQNMVLQRQQTIFTDTIDYFIHE